MAVALMLAIAPQVAYSKTLQERSDKEYDNQYKEKLKELEKGGWKISGDTRTLKVSLLEHYVTLKQDRKNNLEFVGVVSQCTSTNVCRLWAVNNAINYYATLAGGIVAGKVGTVVKGMPKAEVDKFDAAYANRVKADAGGVLKTSFAIVRENSKTKEKEYQTFFVANEKEAKAMREDAARYALSLLETQVVGKELEEIFKIVDEPVYPE